MNFFESLKQGIIGLTLFAGNWFLPAQDEASLSVASINRNTPQGQCRVVMKMDLALNRQIEELIDAGIPLNMKFTAISDRNDTVSTTRSLLCDVASLTYTISDSARNGAKASKPYPMILLALKDYGRWEFSLPGAATACHVEVEMLYSTVSQLNRSVDMSRVWGQRRVKTTFPLAEKRS